MAQTRTTDPIGHLEDRESPNANLSKLAELARHAYEQKRAKDCLDLTRAILLIDPDNADAHWMRSSIQSEMYQDLENVRAFFRQAQSKENTEQESEPSPAASPAGILVDSGGEDLEAPTPETVPLPAASADSRRTPRTRWLAHASVLVVLGGMVAGLSRFITKSNPIEARTALNTPDSPDRIVNLNAAQPDPLLLARSAEVPLASMPAPVPSPASRPLATDGVAGFLPPAPRSQAPPLAANLPKEPVIPAAGGTLAVSSPTAVDIYKDEAYLGSAPVSLELPAGTHTLEYRHGSLRKNVTHVINSNETTRTMITFDVIVQINSKPWAEVFLDGVERKALGQTPLSGVRVPIGSVLILENPQFPAKRYRVTGSERVQIVFP